VATGHCADIVVFDAATVASDKPRVRYDMPGGQVRLFAGAQGIEHVLVNGVEVVRRGELSGATPGTVLRAGRDTADPR
jgi:N-acyl-D-aspartate/D-glutamate deacylase